jgi:hypothetical protein
MLSIILINQPIGTVDITIMLIKISLITPLLRTLINATILITDFTYNGLYLQMTLLLTVNKKIAC